MAARVAPLALLCVALGLGAQAAVLPARAGVGCARASTCIRPHAPARAHTLCTADDDRAPAQPTGRRPRLLAGLRSAAGRISPLRSVAAGLALGLARPSFAAGRMYVPPDVEQAFRREKFSADRLRKLGVKVDSVVTRDFIFSEKQHRVSEVQQEIYDYDDQADAADEGRTLGLAAFVGVSVVGGNLALQGARKVERWMKSRDELERQREIELTGTYVNPFAGDVDEIIDPITGEKKKLEKKPQKPPDEFDGPDGAPGDSPATPDGDGTPPPPRYQAVGDDEEPGDDDDKDGMDLLKDLL